LFFFPHLYIFNNIAVFAAINESSKIEIFNIDIILEDFYIFDIGVFLPPLNLFLNHKGDM